MLSELFSFPKYSILIAAILVLGLTLTLNYLFKNKGDLFWKKIAFIAEVCSIAGLIGIFAYAGKAMYTENLRDAMTELRVQRDTVRHAIERGKAEYQCSSLVAQKDNANKEKNEPAISFCDLTVGLEEDGVGESSWWNRHFGFQKLSRTDFKYNDRLRLVVEPIVDEIENLNKKQINLNRLKGSRVIEEQENASWQIMLCLIIVTFGVSLKATRAYTEHQKLEKEIKAKQKAEMESKAEQQKAEMESKLKN